MWAEDVPLYGGAITCDLPTSFHDASQFREVPDHQEVWVDNDSDRSVIMEILERKTEVCDQDAVHFFLGDIAEWNQAQECNVLSTRQVLVEQEMPRMPIEVTCLHGVCEQTVAKYNEDKPNRVQVYMCVLRLGQQATDLLLTLNNPVSIDPESSSAGLNVVQGAPDVFARIMRSFQIIDWELFNGS